MKVFRKISTIIAIIAIAMQLPAQTNRQKLDSLLNRTLDSMRQSIKAKSLSAAIHFGNADAWKSASGISSETPLVKVTPQHTYLIGSVTKTIIASTIFQLIDENKMKLDDPLSLWIDSLPYIKPTITIRQLLQHQSGIYDVLQNTQSQPLLLADKNKVWDYTDFIKRLIKPAIFEPGTAWSYSNTNYFLLGMIIAKIEKKPYYEVIRTRFLDPLQLSSFNIPAYEPAATPIAHVWIDLNGDGVTEDAYSFYNTWKSLNAVAGSAGGYYATAADLSKWTYNFQRGNLNNAALINEARKTVAAPGAGGITYGLGIMNKAFQGLSAYGHGGDLSYSATSWYFPDKDISISVLNNDSKVISWSLAPVISALLKTYLDNEKLLTTKSNESITEPAVQVSVFPNPTADKLTVRLNKILNTNKIQISIASINGATTYVSQEHTFADNNMEIVLDNAIQQLPTGMYALQVRCDDNSIVTKKIVKVSNN